MTRRKGDYFLPDILVPWDEHSGNQSTTSIRAGGTSGDCLAQHLHWRVVENVCSPLPLCPGLGESSSRPLLTVAPRFAPHPEVGEQLCAGREHHALTWVDNTQGKDTDFFHLLQNGIFFPPLLLLFFILSPYHHPGTGWFASPHTPWAVSSVPGRCPRAGDPAPSQQGPSTTTGGTWGVPRPPMESFRMELWGQGTPVGLTRGTLRDVFPPGF